MQIQEPEQELLHQIRACDSGEQTEKQTIVAVSEFVDDLASRHNSRIQAGKFVLALLREMSYPCCKTISDAILRQVERQELLG